MPIFSRTKKVALTAAGALGLMLASTAAVAQDYYDGPYDRPGEQVTVTAPRHQERSLSTGAPIRDVAVSREVRFNDLDLRTGWGVHALRERVSYTAHRLCENLDRMYPISADNNPPCYRTAMEDAMAQANEAIREARGE